MFDIYCDGKHVWNGVRPFLRDDFVDDDEEGEDDYDSDSNRIWDARIDLYYINSLGDKTDKATYHPRSHEFRPNRYLLSTSDGDKRPWTLNMSFLTTKSAETLVCTITFEPEKLLNHLHLNHTWDDQASMLSNDINLNGIVLNKELKRISGFYLMQ